MNKNIMLLSLLGLLFLSACSSTGIAVTSNTINVSFANSSFSSGSFWSENDTGSVEFNVTETLQYKDRDVWIDKDLFVNDMIIRNTSSLFIGGRDFASISAEELFIPTVNVTLTSVVIDRQLFVRTSTNGTVLMTGVNTNFDPFALSIASAGDPEGNGMTLFKWNKNHPDPYRGQLINLKGNMEMINTYDNNNSNNGSNRIKIGFYQALNITPSARIMGFTSPKFVMSMNSTDINVSVPMFMNNTIGFRHLTAGEIPSQTPNYMMMYCKENNRCYFKRDDGTERRIVDAAGGSFHLDEETYINNTILVLEGNSTLTIENLTGVGNDYACLNENGTLYRSSSACA